MSKTFRPALPLGIAFFGVLASAGASTAAASDDSAPYLFGDWNGERSRLADKGVVFTLGYTSELAHNVTGGDKKLTRNAGQLTLDSAIDLQKLWGWQGASFKFTITERDGDNLNDDARLNELMQSQEIYGRDQTWRLTNLWFGQDFFDQRLQLKVGRLTVGNEFGDFECDFETLALCGNQSGDLIGDYWYNYPVSQWAIVAKWNFSPQFHFKFATYQVNPAYLRPRHSLALDPSGTTGALIPMEFSWTPTFAGRLPGSYVVGGWYSTANKADVYTDINHRPAGLTGLDFYERTGAYGAYFTFTQQITDGDGSTPQSGLRAFFNATQADRSTSTTDREISIGAIDRGLVPGRPMDEVGLGITTTHVNSRVADYERDLQQRTGQFVVRQGSEYTAELFYNWQAAPWLALHPDLQWIKHPGGVTGRDTVRVIGLKTSIAF